MRRTKTIAIETKDDDRDSNKTFVVTEKDAVATERWAARAFLALLRGGAQVPDDVVSAGLAGLTTVGLKLFAQIDPDLAMPLMDEMLTCVQRMPSVDNPTLVRPLIPGDIEELATLLRLRMEVIEVHTGFSVAAALSTFRSKNQAATSANSPTSPAPSVPRLRPVKHR